MIPHRATRTALATIALVGLTLVGLAACVRHIELHPDVAPFDAHRNDGGGLPDAFAGDVIPSDAFAQD